MVVLALGFAIASIMSVSTGIDATNVNTQDMIDETHSNTEVMIGEANNNTQEMIDEAIANAQAMIDTANNNTRKMIDTAISNTKDMIATANNNTQTMIDAEIARTQDMVDRSISGTQEMVNSTEQYFQDMENETERQMTKITVSNMTQSRPPSYSPISTTIIDNISSIDGVQDVVPMIRQSYGVNMGAMGGTGGVPGEGTGGAPGDGGGGMPGGGGTGDRIKMVADYVVYGVPLNRSLDEKYHLLPEDITNGSTINETDNLTVLIHEDLMNYFNASVGDTIAIDAVNFTVKGVYYSSLQNKSVFMSLTDARLLLGLDEGEANYIDVYATNISVVDNVTDNIAYYYPDFRVDAFKDSAAASAEYTQRRQDRQIEQLKQAEDEQVRQLGVDLEEQVTQLEADRDKQVEQFEEDRDVQVKQLEADKDKQIEQFGEDLNKQINQLGEDRDKQVEQFEDDLSNQVNQFEGDMALLDTIGYIVIIISAVTAALIVIFLMFYTVKERTREIGVFKAIGFTGANITTQFVIEGMAIGVLGGIFGLLITVSIGPILSDMLLPSSEIYASSTPALSTIFIALAVTAFLGAFGSLYPAWSASRKNPVEAMRDG